jgi:hypothetical protein
VSDRELWLAATMVELADVRDIAVGEVTYSQNLAARLAEMLVPAEIAVLTSHEPDRLEVAAASSRHAHDLASLDARDASGPATDAFRSGKGTDNHRFSAGTESWPRFAAQAEAAGFDLVTSLVIRRHDQVIGAISVLRTGTHPMSAADIGVAQAVAEAAAVGILLQRALRRTSLIAQQLQDALDSRVIIEQAKGALAARLGIAPDEAFELLRHYARRQNRRLADVADNTIHGTLSPGDLIGVDASAVRPPKR